MTELLSEIEKAKRWELVAAFDKNETIISDQVAALFQDMPVAELDGEPLAYLRDFLSWCASNGVRHCPAKPTTVAAWIVSLPENGGNQERILATLAAIELLHDRHGKPNPVATAIVRAALDRVIKVDPPPRSWPKPDKISFALLPADIRAIIAKRERDRERVMRRDQNAAAKDRQTNGAETKPVEHEKELRDDNQEAARQ
jgi:hypothetical protein